MRRLSWNQYMTSTLSTEVEVINNTSQNLEPSERRQAIKETASVHWNMEIHTPVHSFI